MKKKFAVICHSNHHIDKSFILKKNFLNDLEIYQFTNGVLKEVITDQEVALNSSFVAKFDIFIFYTLQTNKTNILLYELIREQEKIVIAFQESNQLEMHNGDVNNLILQADLIIAASNNEKRALIADFHYKERQVKSYGWLFNQKYHDKNTVSDSNSKYIMLILSAPESITASSYETLAFRKELVKEIARLHPKETLSIKPHPLENLCEVKSLIRIFLKEGLKVELLDGEQEFKDAIRSSKIIYTSNRTQSCIDLLGTGKLVIYKLGEDNFMSDHGMKYSQLVKNNTITFINLSSKNCIEAFELKYINRDPNNFEIIENLITQMPKESEDKYLFNLEIMLWKFLYGMLSKLTLLHYIEINELNKGGAILLNPREITEKDFKILSKNLSIKTAFFLIYVREIIKQNISVNNNIQKMLKQNITRWFAQNYLIDALNVYYYLKSQNLEKVVIDHDCLLLILSTIKILKRKSVAIKAFFFIQDMVSNIENVSLRTPCYKFTNFMWSISRKL